MSHTYSVQFTHIVFSTRRRENLIPADLLPRLFAYVGGINRKLGLDSVAIGGTPNHLHILIGLPPTMRLAEAVQKLKANSSRWLGENGVRFEWQKGYGAFSVSPSMLRMVKNYVQQQEEHHRARTFDDEFLALLRKSGIQFEVRDALG
ncbi:MAG TPA: IS200/IS605 family transposase [Terriglobales bacterium]|nr:IS200/IS605 family transposase [Terriglobales bacterium]